ncbi:hypothetical protein ACFQ8T_01570 [Isoptericola sp. NPDC056618]|uniref:hypothetical protein n=1 Tax=Isoptericola sp. NPDC056618 TaxID=3345878 RepID=UPI0036C5FAF6
MTCSPRLPDAGWHRPRTSNIRTSTGAYLTVATPDASVALPEAAKLAARFLGAFEDTRPDDMTDVFYIHAYNELALVLRDLLNAIGAAEQIGGY